MKKIVTVVIVIISILWVGTTWFSANRTEAIFNEMIAETKQKAAESFPFMEIERLSFEQGFLKSKARTRILLSLHPVLVGQDEPIEVIVDHTIYNGPVMMTPKGLMIGASYIDTTLDKKSLSPDLQDFFNHVFKRKQPVSHTTKVGMDGRLEFEVEVAPIEMDKKALAALFHTGTPSDENVKITLAGISGHFISDSMGTKLKGTCNVGPAEIEGVKEGKELQISMAASVVKMDIDKLYRNALLDGSVEIEVPEIAFSEKGNAKINMLGLGIKTKSGQREGVYAGMVAFDIEKLKVENPISTREIPESKIHLGLDFTGLDRQDVMNLVDSSQKIRTERLKILGFSDADSEHLTEPLIASMEDYYRTLGETVKQGVSIDTRFKLSTEKGHTLFNLDLEYIGARKLLDLETIRDLISALKGQVMIIMDKSLIAGTELEQAIGIPTAMGFAIDKGTTYESVATLGNGELKINDQPMPILDMMGEMADQPLPWKGL